MRSADYLSFYAELSRLIEKVGSGYVFRTSQKMTIERGNTANIVIDNRISETR